MFLSPDKKVACGIQDTQEYRWKEKNGGMGGGGSDGSTEGGGGFNGARPPSHQS